MYYLFITFSAVCQNLYIVDQKYVNTVVQQCTYIFRTIISPIAASIRDKYEDNIIQSRVFIPS